MPSSGLCLECLLAAGRQLRGQVYVPIASSSRLRIEKSAKRFRSTTSSTESTFKEFPESINSASPGESPGTSGVAINARTSSTQTQEFTASTSRTPTLDSTRTLALQRWSALRQSAISALERQQRDLRQKLSEASAKINDISGYKEIEALKAEVTRKELELLEARAEAREAKEAHASALNDRMTSSREVNDLLQRKNNWLESDVMRFTELVRQDHLNEQRERDSKIEVTREEERVERKIGEMMQAILKRYHEEQVWSDKIRSLSTYGTLAITCINVLIFLLAITLVEPWKRKRMVAEVEGRMRDRDEQQIRRLDMQIQDLKQLYSQNLAHQPPLGILGVSPLSMVESSSAATMSNVTSADIDPEANAGGHPAPLPSAQDERPPTRDARYAGTVGALAGAAIVTVWNALFH